MTEQEMPRVPSFNLEPIFHTRNKLFTALGDIAGLSLTGLVFERLVIEICRGLGVDEHGLHRRAVSESVRHLVGRIMSEDQAWELSWLLAANVSKIKKTYAAVYPWSVQKEPEWVPVQVVGTRYHVARKQGEKHGRSGRMFKFQIMAGSSAGHLITQFWANRKADLVAYRIGFKRKPPYIKYEQSEMMSLRFIGLIDPKLSERGPAFFHVKCPSGMRDYNRDIIRMRRRINFVCPNSFTHHCHVCHIGTESCEAATHPTDFVVKTCRQCHREYWFDTDSAYVNDFCIDCQWRVSSGILVPLPVVERDNAET